MTSSSHPVALWWVAIRMCAIPVRRAIPIRNSIRADS
jgi:hypothetical protein